MGRARPWLPLTTDPGRCCWTGTRPTGRMETARLQAHTCECRPVLLELCSRGGGHLIRRTTRAPGTRFRIEETLPPSSTTASWP
jgi:hypothetical protein